MAGCGDSIEEQFYGSVTVGERGQIVIPAEARRKLNISTGEKLLVIGHPPSHGLLLCRLDAFKESVTKFIEGLERLQNEESSEDASND